MSTSDKISIAALVFAILSYIPSFVALHRTTQRISLSIVSFNHLGDDSQDEKELVFMVQFCNPVNMPITISKIELLINNQTYQTDSRVSKVIYLSPNGVSNEGVVFFAPSEIIESHNPARFILHTSSRKIKSKKFIISDLPK